MKKMSSTEIRQMWLDFFKSKGHMIEPGASLVPHNDPTLLWINAGVAALKKYFDGSEIPDSKRIANAQKCIRTNDIDNVGRTARHHTFFEMMGNFSIGDYFRKEAIPFAVELLTSEKWYGLDKNKLYITHHPSDLETKKLWMDNGIAEDHLIALEGNFWEIGAGPCGPDTEIFFDRGEKYDPLNKGVDLLINEEENDRYIEIWNIVFSQFNAVEGEKRENYKELPHKNIDTGAGLERFSCIIQETDTNFETDLFYPYIEEVMKLSSKPYSGEYLMAYRVIADHIRSCTFALADGASFSNEGRGYVLRRVLRRAMRYGQKLGLYEPFLYKLVAKVVENMKSFYPYLEEKQPFVEKMIKNEEEKFIKTLNSGELILEQLIKGKDELSGKDAFKLYDTYGFPIELTEEICLDKNVKVDLEGFKACLNEQKELARASRKNIDSFNKQSKDLMEFNKPSTYTYNDDEIKATVIGTFKDGEIIDKITDEGDIILDSTNFYAEMGGQVADTGFIENDETRCEVLSVNKAPNKQHLHHVKVLYGEIKVNDVVTLKVDHNRHLAIMRNHSATHLLQSALIKVVGDDIKQKGSFVNDEYLRFDFSHFEKISEVDLKKVERLVNSYIKDAILNNTVELPIDEAKNSGAISLFDEKYGNVVRVVGFGDVSKEFCGGNHVKNSQDIGLFVIESEGSIANGVRRIQARTSLAAYELLKQREDVLGEIKNNLKAATYKEAEIRVEQLKNEINDVDEKYKKALQDLINLKTKELVDNFDKTHKLVEYLKGYNKQALMSVFDNLKVRCDDYYIVLVGEENGKHPIIVALGQKLVANGLKSRDELMKICNVLGGSGGGRPDMSQGNVNSIDKFDLVKQDILK